MIHLNDPAWPKPIADDDAPPFKPGDRVRHKTSGFEATVEVCERRFCMSRTRHVVDGRNDRGVSVCWYADDCEPAPLPDAAAIAESFSEADEIERLREEIARQSNEAWMRGDLKTADRLAKLAGVTPIPSEHERAGL